LAVDGVRHGDNNNNNTTKTKKTTIAMGPRRRFTYDAVFDSNCSQPELYDCVAAPLLTSFVDGYNATIMAYGQTGSGKTFTMGSEAHTEPESAQHVGLIPRFITDFFTSMKQKKEVSDKEQNDAGHVLLEFHLEASFLEVYGEDIHDLLDKNREVLPLREDSDGGVVVRGLKTRPIANTAEALQVLHDGTMNRTTAATLMNLTSSRSHAIFTIYLTQVTRSKSGKQVDVTTTSRFTFVDLAGSERMKKTGAEGERAREGIKINEGLLALGNVINALGDEERIAKEKKIHVPYRQSKLTRLLRDALGGNSQTLFLACVSPSDTNASETLSTLNYADRARNIRNAPTKNVDTNVVELQRLHTITRVLQSELIKSRFQIDDCNDESKIGKIDEAIIKREDVEKYISGIYEVANSLLSPQKTVPSPLSFFNSTPTFFSSSSTSTDKKSNQIMIDQKPSFDGSVSTLGGKSDGNDFKGTKRASTNFDDSILDDINPDEEMKILDYLLELQQNEQDYDKEKSHDDAKLEEMDSELAKGEEMLLQLRESLKVYHGLKSRYEDLMAEVQKLETEKASLAKQLEQANADPTQGCSAAIKRKLDTVEINLSRARRETLTHRQKYRKAEDHARKCQVLERKVNELKQAKILLLKKQKEAETKYREVNEAKTKELLVLKRKERAADKKVSKLENEINIHKNTLTKRNKYCAKLTEKLRQTEDHLVKLLAMRQQRLSKRAISSSSRGHTISGASHKRKQDGRPVPSSTKYDVTDEDMKAAKYVFDSMVSDKVKENMLRTKYGELVTEYGETMRKVVLEVKMLGQMRGKARHDGQPIEREKFQEKEETIADLELKVELLDADLQELSSQLPQDNVKADHDMDTAITKLMSAMSAPVLRNMLMETYSKFVESETDRRTLQECVHRKDAALLSFETEVDSLNYKISSLSTELADRNMIDEDENGALTMAQESMKENRELQKEFQSKNEALNEAYNTIQNLESTINNLQNELSTSKDNFAVVSATMDHSLRRLEAEQTVEKLQGIWKELGVEYSVCDQSRLNILRCLEDTCSREVENALEMKSESESEVSMLTDQVEYMRSALAIRVESTLPRHQHLPILENLASLRREHDKLKNPFSFASTRREKLIKDATALSEALGITHDALTEDLQILLLSQSVPRAHNDGTDGELSDIDVSTAEVLPPGCLESTFLTRCEGHVGELRVKKSQLLASSRDHQQEIVRLVQSMHLNAKDVLRIVTEQMRRGSASIPEWWNPESAHQIVEETIQSKFMVTPDVAMDKYLSTICTSLADCASSRNMVSEKLKSTIEASQRTLLDIVGRELDAREAYAGFHDALFRLPPMSKDLILSCISELEALIEGIEAMTGSETEALTVVWEALKTPTDERSDFWGAIEKSISRAKEDITGNSFLTGDDEAAVSCSCEDWMMQAIRRASEVQNELQVKLSKLGEIHNEVERLRTRQEAKSRILSLDAEIRVMNAKLVDFEDFQCDKNRLLNKKTGGSALLKEERFRKQMQSKFASHLEQLATLLREWEKRENSPFDASVLSEDVRKLAVQHEPAKMEKVVENRTKLMSLRTVKTHGQSPSLKDDKSTASSSSSPSSSSSTAAPTGRHRTTSAAGRVEKKGQKHKYQSGLTPSRKRRAITSEKDPFGLSGKQSEQPKPLHLSGKRSEHQQSSQRPPKLTERPSNSKSTTRLRSDTPNKTKNIETSAHASKRPRNAGSAPIPPFGRILDGLDSPTDTKFNTEENRP